MASEGKRDFQAAMLSLVTASDNQLGIAAVLEELPELEGKLRRLHPVESSSLAAGLLVDPKFHANSLRIEMLVHLILLAAQGNGKPTVRDLKTWLNKDLGSTSFAFLEDPVEDVFISNVTSEDGNHRIFEGTWESSDFFLQRILGVLETLPDNDAERGLKREVSALLRISEEVAERQNLSRYSAGEGIAKETIEIPPMKRLKDLRASISFSVEDLEVLGVSPDDLTNFVFDPRGRESLRHQALGASELERRPILYDGLNWYVLMPAAISVAIRRRVLEWMSRSGFQKSFDQHLMMEYGNLFAETPILGSVVPEEVISTATRSAGRLFLEVAKRIDVGRYLHVMAVVDSIKGFEKYGLSSPSEDVLEVSHEIGIRIERVRSHHREIEGFRQGLTVVVSCGYGRPGVLALEGEESDWWVELVSAADLQTLSWVPRASSLFLWKLVEQERFLETNEVSIMNANGLVNLYGWWADMDYHLLPSEAGFGEGPLNLMIPTDCIAKVRTDVRRGWDAHLLPLPCGEYALVRRYAAETYFSEGVDQRLYGSIRHIAKGELLGACVGDKRVWWLDLDTERTRLSSDFVYKIWDALLKWLARAVPVLERRPHNLASGPIRVTVDLNQSNSEQSDPMVRDDLDSLLSVSTDPEGLSIRITLLDSFTGGFRNVKNVAERALVRALAIGFFRLSGQETKDSDLYELVAEIVPDDDARFLHVFEASRFRDHIRHYDRPKGIRIDDSDTARTVLGLGWLVEENREHDRFQSKEESSQFLNGVVAAVWLRIRERLRTLNRLDFIETALRYGEGIVNDTTNWERTLRAILALQQDEEAAKQIAMREISRYTNSGIALRILIEMATSECPIDDGSVVGVLDLSSLMSDTFCMYQLGGWSDAIRKEVMAPEVIITPNGDVKAHMDFWDDIAQPMAKGFQSRHLEQEVTGYAELYEDKELRPSAQTLFPAAFCDAFATEFGLSLDALFGTREALENLAEEKRKCVLIARESEILDYCETSELSSRSAGKAVLSRFALWPREAWDSKPDGYFNKDWYPWRFGRRLSLVSRPLIRLEDAPNPRYVISPGMLGDSIAYNVSRYFHGEAHIEQCESRAMRKWIDKENNRRGHAFSQEVAEALQGLGYEIRLEETVSALVREKLDKNFGDVDVLAWGRSGADVLAVECKDLRLAKTANEIAEQLNRFSGQVKPNGARDELRKHLDRCDILEKKSRRVAQSIGISNTEPHIRPVVCFSAPVPMQYVAARFPGVSFLTIDQVRAGELSE